MKIILIGASGMIGQGALQAALLDPKVTKVVCVVRAATGQSHLKLHEIVVPDLFALDKIQDIKTRDVLSNCDACLFCVGVSSAGLDEPIYTKMTYDLTLSVAENLLPLNPNMTFIYVSGAGTDTTEKGPFMWARVKGKLENALLKMPFKAAYMFRPGAIQPLDGIKSKVGWYNVLYTVLAPISPLMVRYLPQYVTTTRVMARAMLKVARDGYDKRVLESVDINALS